jgi:hypothetical protein
VRPLVQDSQADSPTDQIITVPPHVRDSRTILNNRTMLDVPGLRRIITMSRVRVARIMVGQVTVQTTMLPVPEEMKMLLAPELLIIGLLRRIIVGLQRRKIATRLRQTITMFLVRLQLLRHRSSSLGNIRARGLRTIVRRKIPR